MLIYKELEENKQFGEQKFKKIEEELKLQLEKQNEKIGLLEKHNLTLEQSLRKVSFILYFRCKKNWIVFMKKRQRNREKVE